MLPHSLGHGQAASFAVDLTNCGVGLTTLLLPWHRWKGRWTLVLAVVAFANIAWADTVTRATGPSYGVYFVLVFAWIGACAAPPDLTRPRTARGGGLPRPRARRGAGPDRDPGLGLARDPGGGPHRRTIAYNATSARRRAGELRHQALHDALTGLPNRSLIEDRIEQMLARAAREPIAIGVLYLDLDNFRDVNDSLGHRPGGPAPPGGRPAAERRGPRRGRHRRAARGRRVRGAGRGLASPSWPRRVAAADPRGLAEPSSSTGWTPAPGRAGEHRRRLRARPGTPTSCSGTPTWRSSRRSGRKGRYVMFQPEMQLASQDRVELEGSCGRADRGVASSSTSRPSTCKPAG